MARLYSTGFELNSTTTGVEGDTYSGVTVSTTNVRTGTYALRANAAATTPFWRTQLISADSSTAIAYFRFYLYIASAPTTTTQIARIVNSSNVQQSLMRLTTTSTLQLFNGSVVQVGSDSSALSANTWYRVEYSWNPATGATAAYLDGVSFASGTGTTGSWSRVLLGAIVSTTCDLYFDDVAINDDSGSFQNGLPGSGKLICLRPSAAGDANGFLVQVGGTVGSANNFTRVNEVTPDDATTYNASAVLNAEDLFNVTDSGIGASDTVNVVSIGARLADITAADATTGIKLEVEKTASGTKTQSANIVPNSTTWRTNGPAAPFNYPLTTYQDPDGAAWTQTTLDSMQVGYIIDATAVRAVGISTVWALVDYTPSVAPPPTASYGNLSMMGIS